MVANKKVTYVFLFRIMTFLDIRANRLDQNREMPS